MGDQSPSTTEIEPGITTFTVSTAVPVPVPRGLEGYEHLESALEHLGQFHQSWNAGDIPTLLNALSPDSLHRADSVLMEIAMGMNAHVEIESCGAANTPVGDPVIITCVIHVDDDFYGPAGLRLETEVVYEVTSDGIDIRQGDPIWAIRPTGLPLEYLTEFDAMAGRYQRHCIR